MYQQVFVLTGVTSGMGLHIVQRLIDKTGARLIAGVRSPDRAQDLRRIAPPDRLEILRLDVADLSSVRDFAAEVKARIGATKLAGIVCNAGLQILGPAKLTGDGVDESFATNHLGHFALVDALMPCLATGATVITTGSGTHNPNDRVAKMFGFRGADFPDAATVAAGQTTRSGDLKTQGQDRYATGKLCAILYAHDMSARVDAQAVRFFSFDPGLMPGTGLARDRSFGERFAWRYIMPLFRYVMAGVSTPRRSGYALVDKLLLAPAYPSGSYIEFTGKPAPRSPLAISAELGRDLHAVSARIVQDRAA